MSVGADDYCRTKHKIHWFHFNITFASQSDKIIVNISVLRAAAASSLYHPSLIDPGGLVPDLLIPHNQGDFIKTSAADD